MIRNSEEFETWTLNNGIRLIHKKSKSLVSHIGVMIHAGSRDELDHEHGLTHLIEHALFKGTKKRSSSRILNRLEEVGGEINAYTTKEETCLHATFLNKYYARATELISDLIFNSVFPEKEIVREKEVIVDEIKSYWDSPSELIFDEFEEMLYPDQTIGRNILGTESYLKKFSVADIQTYISENYTTDQIVISSVGDIPFNRFKALAQKNFEQIPSSSSQRTRAKLTNKILHENIINKDTHQAHCMIGARSYGFDDPKRLGMYLISNYLGGPFLSSRLNMLLREQKGLSYNVESNYNTFTDTGVFSVYFGTDKEDVAKCFRIIEKEFKQLRDFKISDALINKLKKQVIAQLAINSENNESQMLSMAKSILVFDKVDQFKSIYDKINAINPADIMQIANEILIPERLSKLSYL